MADHDARPEADVVISDDPGRYRPFCPVCQEPRRERARGFSDRLFICASCGACWIVKQP